MARRYFGTDGIRGRANRVITPELALKVGQAAALIFRNGDHKHRVLIGKDTRLSGYMIRTATNSATRRRARARSGLIPISANSSPKVTTSGARSASMAYKIDTSSSPS